MPVRPLPFFLAFLWLFCLPAFAGIGITAGIPDGFEQLELPHPSVISYIMAVIISEPFRYR